MKLNIRYIIAMAALLMVSMQLRAETMPHDTVFFYKTWQQILDKDPEAVIIDPWIEVYTPFELYIETTDEKLNKSMREDYVAATLGDSTWLISSDYVKQNFKGDVKKLSGFMPLMFNDKVAYFLFFNVNAWNMSVVDILFGETASEGSSSEYAPDIFYMDFKNHKVKKLTPEVLSGLLEDYHDLQMRYEGMKDYKKRPIIEDYFYKYIDRATDDIMRPYILDLVETE